VLADVELAWQWKRRLVGGELVHLVGPGLQGGAHVASANGRHIGPLERRDEAGRGVALHVQAVAPGHQAARAFAVRVVAQHDRGDPLGVRPREVADALPDLEHPLGEPCWQSLAARLLRSAWLRPRADRLLGCLVGLQEVVVLLVVLLVLVLLGRAAPRGESEGLRRCSASVAPAWHVAGAQLGAQRTRKVHAVVVDPLVRGCKVLRVAERRTDGLHLGHAPRRRADVHALLELAVDARLTRAVLDDAAALDAKPLEAGRPVVAERVFLAVHLHPNVVDAQHVLEELLAPREPVAAGAPLHAALSQLHAAHPVRVDGHGRGALARGARGGGARRRGHALGGGALALVPKGQRLPAHVRRAME